MKNLLKIPVSINQNKFEAQITHGTSIQLDFFTLVTFECIKNYQNKNATIADALRDLEIPKELNYIFKQRIEEMCNNLSLIETENDYGYHRNNQNDWLQNTIEKYSLTESGEQAYRMKEMPIQKHNEAVTFYYDMYNKVLIKTHNKADENVLKLVEINEKTGSGKEIEVFCRNKFSDTPKEFLKNANQKTKIYDFVLRDLGNVLTKESIEVVLDENEIKCYHKNDKVLESFQSTDNDTKYQFAQKSFLLVDTHFNTLNKNNMSVAKIGEKKKMKAVVFASPTAHKFVEKYDIQIVCSNDSSPLWTLPENMVNDFQFIGIDEKNMPIVYKYKQEIVDGMPIGFEENIRDKHIYLSNIEPIIQELLSMMKKAYFKNALVLGLALLPTEKQKDFFQQALNTTNNLVNSERIESIEQISESLNNHKEFQMIVKDFLVNTLEEYAAQNKLSYEQVIKISQKNGIENNMFFPILEKHFPKTDEMLNELFGIDLELSFKIFNIKKLYFEKLLENKLHELKHKNQIYSNFLKFEYKLKELNTKYGFIDYFNYSFPSHDNKEAYRTAIIELVQIFNLIKPNLSERYIKEFNEFAENIGECFYDLTPTTFDKIKLDSDFTKNILTKISEKNPDIIGISANIRLAFEQEFSKMEEQKGSAQTDLKGKQRIFSLIKNPDFSSLVYQSWRNLCKILHGDNNKKAVNENLQQLKQALSIFNRLKSYTDISGSNDNETTLINGIEVSRSGIIKAIQHSKNKNGKYELSRLNNYLGKFIPGFDFKSFGCQTFKEFASQMKEFFEIESHENGIVYLSPNINIPVLPEMENNSLSHSTISKDKDSREKKYKEIPIEKVKFAFSNCKKERNGKVTSASLYDELIKLIPGFDQRDYGNKFSEFYKKSNLFEIEIDKTNPKIKYLKLK